MAKASFVGVIKALSWATSLLIKWKATDTTSGQMERPTTENGLITSCMAKALLLGTMDARTSVTSLMTKRKALVLTDGQMAASMKENGRMVSNTDMAPIQTLKKSAKMAFGKQEKSKSG